MPPGLYRVYALYARIAGPWRSKPLDATRAILVAGAALFAADQIKVMDDRQAAALFFIAPMIAVSMAPPAPPAIT